MFLKVRRSDWALTSFKGWFLGCGTTLLIGFVVWLAGTIFILLEPNTGPSRGPDAGAILISFGLLALLTYWGIAFAALLTVYGATRIVRRIRQPRQ